MHIPTLPSKLEHRQFLGAGGMGQVHLAFDRERNEDVALKVLIPSTSADALEARFLFKQEYWAMATLRHPGLVAAYDYGELPDGTPYLTMEWVPGHDLQIDAPLDEAAVRAWLPGIAAALGYLHRQGYVHGDLKPENIRIVEAGGVSAKLMDLGLLARVGRPTGAVRGTLDYIAPESIRQGAPDGRADLYALGAVLYHALAGRPPFEDDTPLALLHAHLERRPTPLKELRPDLSPELAAAVMQLLEKSPAARFPHAAALLESLGLSVQDAGPAGLLGSAIVGRDEPQEELRGLIADAQFGVRWLVGEPGAGKTRLLQETRAEALLAGLPAPSLRGLGVEAPPYQALRPLIESLVEGAIASSEDGGALALRLAPVLVALVPELGERLGIQPAPALEGAQERLRLQLAITDLAVARHTQAFWLVDDWDRLDPASREVLVMLLRRGADLGWRWAISTTDMPAETQPGSRLVLLPLAESDVLLLTRALLGQTQLPTAVIERVAPLSGGYPGAVEAVLGHWLRTGALQHGPTGWVAGPDHGFDLPGGLRVAMDARFEALDADTRRVAATAAILGSQGDLPWLAALVDADEATFFSALHALESADVLVLEASGGSRNFRFVRPAQAALLAGTWETGERKALHGRAARWLANRLDGDPSTAQLPLSGLLEAARHFLASDTPEAGLPWALAGVRRALAMFELEAGEALIAEALALDGLSDDDRLTLKVFRANKLRYQGRTDDAIAWYQSQDLIAGLEAAHHVALAQETVSFAVLHYLKSMYPEARAGLLRGQALAESLDQAIPYVRALMFLGRLTFFQGDAPAAREYLTTGLARARSAGLRNQLAAILGFYGYVLASTDPGRSAEGLAFLDESIALNEELGDPTEANEALDLQGNLFLASSRFLDARRAFEAVLANSSRLGMDLDSVTARMNLGAVMLELGDLQAGEASARQAQEGALRQGRKFPQGYALALEGTALVAMGRPASGAERLQRGLALAREIGNKYLELNVLALWAPTLVMLGRYDEAGEAIAIARGLARQTQNVELSGKFDLAATILAVSEVSGEPDGATRVEIQDRLNRLEQTARGAEQAVPLAHALRWQAAWRLRVGAYAEALTAAEESLTLGRAHGLRGLEAELSRILAQALLAQNRTTEARAHFEASRSLAETLGARPLALLNELSLGALDHDVRRRRDAARALRALNDLPQAFREAYDRLPERAAVLAAADPAGDEAVSARVRDLLDWLAAIDRTEVLGDVLELGVRALVQLSEAERGFLLLVDGVDVTHQTFYGMSSADSDEYSTSLAYEVLYRGEPMIMEDVQADESLGHRASIQALALRAVVGVPLIVDGQAIGTMLADSRRVTPGFGVGLRDLVVPLGEHVARAAARAREREWQRQALADQARLFDLALAVVGKSRLEDFFAPFAAWALELTGAQQAFLLVGPQLACRIAFDADGKQLPADGRELSQSVCQWVYDRGEPLYLADAQASPDFQRQKSVLALGLRAIHAVPVEHDGHQVGVLYLQNRYLGLEDPAALRVLMRAGELIGAFLAAEAVKLPT